MKHCLLHVLLLWTSRIVSVPVILGVRVCVSFEKDTNKNPPSCLRCEGVRSSAPEGALKFLKRNIVRCSSLL